MKQVICDICGKPILKGDLSRVYRIQKRVWGLASNPEWGELDVHSRCMTELIEIIRRKQKNEEG